MATKRIIKGGSEVILRSVMKAVVPRGGAFPAGAEDYDLIPAAEKYLGAFDRATRRAFPLMLRYIQLSSFFRTGRRFTRLPPEKAAKFLEGMETSTFYHRRVIIMLLKLITTLVLFDIDEVAAQIGYIHGCPPGGETDGGSHVQQQEAPL